VPAIERRRARLNLGRAAAENIPVSLFAAVVSYALPDVEREPGKLPAWVHQSLPLVGAALVAGCLIEFGATLHGFCVSVFCLALVIVTATDLEYRLIPNRVVGPASVIVLTGMTVAEPSPRWAISAFGASLFLLVFSIISPEGMGMGDVKLAFLMGAALGPHVAVALVLASLASLVPSVFILARHGRAGRKVGFPFGPFLALGSLLTLFLYGAL
jgi:prepilin signal peptidase PulO-like enzyme (type II secretory pathway)